MQIITNFKFVKILSQNLILFLALAYKFYGKKNLLFFFPVCFIACFQFWYPIKWSFKCWWISFFLSPPLFLTFFFFCLKRNNYFYYYSEDVVQQKFSRTSGKLIEQLLNLIDRAWILQFLLTQKVLNRSFVKQSGSQPLITSQLFSFSH